MIRIAAITLASDSAITIARFRPSKLPCRRRIMPWNIHKAFGEWNIHKAFGENSAPKVFFLSALLIVCVLCAQAPLAKVWCLECGHGKDHVCLTV